MVPSMKSTQALRCFLFTVFTWREEQALKILILIKQGYFSVDIIHYNPHLHFFSLVQIRKNQVEASTSYPKVAFLVHKMLFFLVLFFLFFCNSGTKSCSVTKELG